MVKAIWALNSATPGFKSCFSHLPAWTLDLGQVPYLLRKLRLSFLISSEGPASPALEEITSLGHSALLVSVFSGVEACKPHLLLVTTQELTTVVCSPCP